MSNRTQTTNGAKAYKSTLSATLDLFASVGAMRGKDITASFAAALSEDSDLAMRIMLWARDVRGGSGERKLFRDVLPKFQTGDIDLPAFYSLVVKVGRWDDLFTLIGHPEHDIPVTNFIADALRSGDGLLAKWMPRKGDVFNHFRRHMGLTPKELRKMLVSNSNTVEQLMSAGKWSEINYSHVPSVASARYQKAFGRRDTERYVAYLEALTKGDPSVKINAGAVYPYDVVASISSGLPAAADAQWKALPNYLEGSDARILTMVDVSGSMSCRAGGYSSKSNVTCMDVAVSLGLYIAERLSGPLRDHFMTFSERPELIKLKGNNLSERVSNMKRSNWGMSTNLELAFERLLDHAKKLKVSKEEMPTMVLILSDMQFNNCVKGSSALESIRNQYAKAGYTLPSVVFWNINSQGNQPATLKDKNVALVSGFSPAILQRLLSAKTITPLQIMLDTVATERYDIPYSTEVRELSVTDTTVTTQN